MRCDEMGYGGFAIRAVCDRVCRTQAVPHNHRQIAARPYKQLRTNLGPSERSPARAALADPASLPGSDSGFLSAIAGEARAQLEMRRVFQAVAPSEAVLAHDPH